MSIHFISDLHLDASRPGIARAFFHYLQNLPADCNALYILGDFFEAWVGDDDDEPFVLEVQQALKTATDNGLPIYFMHGNRDFLIAEQFAKNTGCTLLPECEILEFDGKRYGLMHGDSLCTDDVEYQQFRSFIRSPEVLADLQQKPLAERKAMAKTLREQSQMANSNKADNIMDVNTDAVAKVFDEHNIDILIHGHTHRPAIHDLGNNLQRIVLGDWHDVGYELVLRQNQAPQLLKFSINERN